MSTLALPANSGSNAPLRRIVAYKKVRISIQVKSLGGLQNGRADYQWKHLSRIGLVWSRIGHRGRHHQRWCRPDSDVRFRY